MVAFILATFVAIVKSTLLATEKIILGIDPGTTIMGFGIIRIIGKKMEFVQPFFSTDYSI